ncbi:hypothetical protein [Micromonospora sp. NPDC049240]|uniref:hypothetical protein n=1 Tax=Micromonospora sp. NPDC049240 TaxID=3155151 RepID=UPI0033D84FE1
MAITAFPFDNQDTTEDQYSKLFRELQDSGVVGSATGTDCKVTADGSGMRVFIQPGSTYLRGVMGISDAVETRTIQPASAAIRVDRVVWRMDPAANTATIAVIQGSPGGGVPALTRTSSGVWEEPLGRITINPGDTSVSLTAVTDDRRFIGGRVRAWSSTLRPDTPRASDLGYNLSTGKWEFWDGSAWGNPAFLAAPPLPMVEKVDPDTTSITATSWSNVSSMPLLTLTLPMPALVQVEYSAWMAINAGASGDLRAGVSHNGAAPQDLFGGTWGDVLFLSAPADGGFSQQHSMASTMVLPAGDHTFRPRAYRSGSRGSTLSYQRLRVRALRWEDPRFLVMPR